MRMAATVILSVMACGVASAQETTTEIGAGGLVFARSQSLETKKMTLFISAKEVRADYVVASAEDGAVETLVAFPFPDVDADPEKTFSIGRADNFLDFFAMADGKLVQPQLDQTTSSLLIDVGEVLTGNKIPLYPYHEGVMPALAGLSAPAAANLLQRDMIQEISEDESDDANIERVPNWSYRSAYWWKQTFPANREIGMSIRYKPAVGSSDEPEVISDGAIDEDKLSEYESTYCLDDAFKAAIRKSFGKDGVSNLSEQRIDFLLAPRSNWAAGDIGEFKLTIDAGAPDAVMSACLDGFKKTAPSVYELSADALTPEDDIYILILTPKKN